MNSQNHSHELALDPVLYRVTDENGSFLLLGTRHAFGLDIYTAEVKNLLLSQKRLFIERLKFTVSEMVEDFFTIESEFYLRKNNDTSYYLALPEHEKAFIQSVLCDLLNVINKRQLTLDNLKDDIIFGMFFGIALECGDESRTRDCVDIELREVYKNNNNEIVGLEEPKALFQTIVNGFYSHLPQHFFLTPTANYHSLYENAYKSKLALNKQPQLNMYTSSYIDPEVAERNVNWMPTINSITNDKTSALIAVGMTHLFERNDGLLLLFERKGCFIEKSDQYGNFNPFGCNHSHAHEEEGELSYSQRAVPKVK